MPDSEPKPKKIKPLSSTAPRILGEAAIKAGRKNNEPQMVAAGNRLLERTKSED